MWIVEAFLLLSSCVWCQALMEHSGSFNFKEEAMFLMHTGYAHSSYDIGKLEHINAKSIDGFSRVFVILHLLVYHACYLFNSEILANTHMCE